MIKYGSVKRGDTFAFLIKILDEEENPIVPELIRCHLRDRQYRLITEANITEGEEPGEYLFDWGDTKEWPIGPLLFDIEITDSVGNIISTDTIELVVERDVTYGN